MWQGIEGYLQIHSQQRTEALCPTAHKKKRNATINYVFGSGSFPDLASYETSTPAKILIAAS